MGLEPTRLIFALTGAFGSGCSTVADILKSEAGCYVYSISESLREIAPHRDIALPDSTVEQRETLQNLGNDIRREEGLGALVRRVLSRIADKGIQSPIVIDSIKNTGEIDALREFPNAYVVAIDASFSQRWDRLAEKEYDRDQKQFIRDDKRDEDQGPPYGQQVKKCVDLADIVISNDDDWGESLAKKQEFIDKVKEYADLIREPETGRYPTVDELLMNAAYSASALSRCLSRKVGAAILKPDRDEIPFSILAMGYNHVPRGTRDCKFEHGECLRERKTREIVEMLRHCPPCRSKVKDRRCSNTECDYSKPHIDLVEKFTLGRGLDVCPAVHAEESAILQVSSLAGPSLEGSRMFVTTQPCLICAKMIADSGIREVVYVEAYPMDESIELLEGAGVELSKFEGVKAQAFYKLFRRD